MVQLNRGFHHGPQQSLELYVQGVRTWLLANEPEVVIPSLVVRTIPRPKQLSSLCQEVSMEHTGPACVVVVVVNGAAPSSSSSWDSSIV